MVDFKFSAKTAEGKWRECVLFKEALRLEHNSVGAKFRAGEIAEQEWLDYKEEFDLKTDWLADEVFRLEQEVINGN